MHRSLNMCWKNWKFQKKLDHFRVCLRCLNMIELLKWWIFVYWWLRALRSARCRTTEGGLAFGLAGFNWQWEYGNGCNGKSTSIFHRFDQSFIAVIDGKWIPSKYHYQGMFPFDIYLTKADFSQCHVWLEDILSLSTSVRTPSAYKVGPHRRKLLQWPPGTWNNRWDQKTYGKPSNSYETRSENLW